VLDGRPNRDCDFLYFGLVGTNTINGKEVIPFFAQERESYVEYDLTSLVYSACYTEEASRRD